MTEWKTYRLGEVCSRVCSGGTPKSTVAEYYDGDIPWLNTKEIDFNFIDKTERRITQAGLDNSSAKWIDENSVIIAMYGATAGKCAITKIRLTTNQACCNLAVNPDLADYRYVYYAVKNDYIRLASLANGGAQQNLNAQQIKDFELSLPPLPLQRRIASVLSSLDAKIETNRKINARLEEMAQALFRSWFIDFTPFKDDEFIEDNFGRRPKGWEVVSLGEIGEIVGGATPSKEHEEYYAEPGKGIAWLTPKDLSVTNTKFTARGSIDITESGYQKSSTRLMPKGSILFSSRAPIGYITIATNEICTNQGFKSLVPQKVGTAFAYYLLKELTPEIENKATGSTFKEASTTLMKSLQTTLPTKAIANEFENKMKPIFEKQYTCEQEISRLSTLRDTLLPKLMSGELIIEEV